MLCLAGSFSFSEWLTWECVGVARGLVPNLHAYTHTLTHIHMHACTHAPSHTQTHTYTVASLLKYELLSVVKYKRHCFVSCFSKFTSHLVMCEIPCVKSNQVCFSDRCWFSEHFRLKNFIAQETFHYNVEFRFRSYRYISIDGGKSNLL